MAVDERKLEGIAITLELTHPEKDPLRYIFSFPVAWALYNVCMRDGGVDDAWQLALLGAAVDRALPYEGTGQDIYGDVPVSTDNRLRLIIHQFWLGLKEKYDTRDDLLLYASYYLLRAGQFSRAEAAEFASQLLGERIENDTWRKRVNKYVQDHNLEPLSLQGGRPRNPEK
jgi:hypothetical protein